MAHHASNPDLAPSQLVSCCADFAIALQQTKHVKHSSGRSVHLDESGLWGCDEYGCDSFLTVATQDGMEKAYAWINAVSLPGHPAEFAH